VEKEWGMKKYAAKEKQEQQEKKTTIYQQSTINIHVRSGH